VPPDKRLHVGQVDFVILADYLADRTFAKLQAAMLARRRAMVFVHVGRLRQCAGVSLLPRLGAPGPRTFPLALPIGRLRIPI